VGGILVGSVADRLVLVQWECNGDDCIASRPVRVITGAVRVMCWCGNVVLGKSKIGGML
jgi:3-dehydroquinate synthase class II